MTSNLSLHKAVFEGDSQRVEQIAKNLKEEEINSQDIHGNTALHIAAMKGNRRCVELLVKSGAKATIANELNWFPLQEAISYGDYHITKILAELELVSVVKMLTKDKLIELFSVNEHNFVIKFEIRKKQFQPIITPIPKYTECVITMFKKDNRIRFDSQVRDQFHYYREPLRFSSIFDLKENLFKLILRNAPIYQTVPLGTLDRIMADFIKNEMIDLLVPEAMKKENLSINLELDPIHSHHPLFHKVYSKKVAGLATDIFESKGVDMIRRVRTEHIIARDELGGVADQQSLPPPEPRAINWDQYINAPKGQFPYLGRKPIETIQTNRISIVVGITHEMPIKFKWHWIVNLATGLLDYKIAEPIRQQIISLPEGFPSLIDFPLHRSTDYYKWKLVSFDVVSDVSDSVFDIPNNYHHREIIPIRHSIDSEDD